MMEPTSRVRWLYFCLFLPQGMIIPFLPAWMAERSIPLSVIGGLLALSYILKIIVNPAIGRLSDLTGSRPILIGLAITTAGLYGLLALPSWSWTVAVVILVAIYIAQPGQYPLCEHVAADVSKVTGTAYGSMRMWGSIGFALGGLACGRLIDQQGTQYIGLWIGGGFLAAAVVAAGRDRIREPIGQVESAARKRSDAVWRAHWAVLAAGSLVQSSNAFLYGYGGIYLLSRGWDAFSVGSLWAVGIAFEVLALAYSRFFISRATVRTLFIAAAIATSARWVVFASTSTYVVLAAAQSLQALTIGVTNAALIAYVNSGAVPQSMRGSVLGLYGALANGAAMGLMVLVCGWIYPHADGYSFLLMACVALAGAGCAALIRQCTGNKVIPVRS